MLTALALALALALAPAMTAPSAAGARPIAADGRLAHWDLQQNRDPEVWAGAGLRLQLSSRRRGRDHVRAHLTVFQAGRKAIELTGAEGFTFAPADFAIARFDRAAQGSGVLFVTNTGGAHCCVRMAVAETVGGRWRSVRLGDFDMDAPERVVDVDGDGIADIVVVDDAFDYAFASFAGSDRPPRIYNIVGGRRRDVSADPKYRPLFETDQAEAAKVCLRGDPKVDEINGACAAYVADGARLGRFDAAWAQMLAHYDKRSNPDFPSALRALLAQKGYLGEPGQRTP